MSITKVTNRALANESVGTSQLSAEAVTVEKLNINVQHSLLPAGAVQAFARTAAPNGWLVCNGQVIPAVGTVFQGVSVLELQNLRNILATNFGTTFGTLPDLRGEFIRGWDNNRGLDAGRSFGTVQGDIFRSHNHGGVTGTDFPDHGHPMVGYNLVLPGRSIPWYNWGNSRRADDVGQTGGANARHQHGINSDGGNETRPRNVALLYCIKY